MRLAHRLIKAVAIIGLFLTGVSLANQLGTTSNDVSAATITTKRNRVVRWAKREIGKPYVWGATGPYGFDCSGLVQYVYSHAISWKLASRMGRSTYNQVYAGRHVSLSHLKKGDLIFWGSKSAPYHVGIYVGGGCYIHAPQPGQRVRRQHLSGYFYPSAAKRVL